MHVGRRRSRTDIDHELAARKRFRFQRIELGQLFFQSSITGAGVTFQRAQGTGIGLFIEAVGDNEVASHLSGVNTRGIKLFVYMFCAACAALAALVAIGDVGRVEPDRLGQMLELDAITAVVVGGTVLTGGRFSLAGSVVGALLIQTLTVTLIRQGMPSDVAPVPKALVIIVVCLLQSPRLRGQLAALRPGARRATA